MKHEKNNQEKISNLKEVCAPVVDFITRKYDPHTTIIITDSQIKLVNDEIGIPTGVMAKNK